ncbi:MAG: DUF2779 domain-containing protein [Candidatus Magasanikbacteria bacterium]
MQLSKSDYIKFLKHPAWLWLKKHKPHLLPEPDEDDEAAFDAGDRFEQKVYEIFPEAVEVDFDDYEQMSEKTKRIVESEAETILQPKFQAGRLTCICDILKRVEDNTFHLFEIKSTTSVKPEHKHGLAFQTLLLETCGLEVRGIGVIHVDRNYVREKEIDPTGVSKLEEVTTQVRDQINDTKKEIKQAAKVVESQSMPDPSPRHVQVGKTEDWMEIYRHIHDLESDSIYHLTNSRKKLTKLEDKGVETVGEIPQDDLNLSDRQSWYVETVKDDKRIIEREKIRKFLDSLTFPLCFLDYETARDVVPPYEKTRPYQQIPFQYSMHILGEPDGELEHRHYLHKDETHPVASLVEKMKQDIPEEGSIIVWNEWFEQRCNDNMAQIHPEYTEFLQGVNERIVDLMTPFEKGWFVNKKFRGSASIKNVLPVLVDDMDYDKLDIQDGRAAQRRWMNAVLREQRIDKEKLFAELEQYCRLDTLAMVEIWRVLKKEVD